MKKILDEIIKVIKNDDLETLKYLFLKNKSLGNLRVNSDGDTPLMLSLQEKSNKCTNFLMSNTDLSIKNYSNKKYDFFLDKEANKDYIKINSILEIEKDKKAISPYIKNNKDKTPLKL